MTSMCALGHHTHQRYHRQTWSQRQASEVAGPGGARYVSDETAGGGLSFGALKGCHSGDPVQGDAEMIAVGGKDGIVGRQFLFGA